MNRQVEDMQILFDEWESRLKVVLGACVEELLICTPFITKPGAAFLVKHVSKAFRKSGNLILVTNLSVRNLDSGATDPHSLKTISESFDSVKLWDLPNLHAKLYIADGSTAIITSANLTQYGLSKNFECGVLVSLPDEALVAYTKEQITKSAVAITNEKLEALIKLYDKLQLQQAPHSSLLEAAVEELAQIEYGGKSDKDLFEEQIALVLKEKGAMTTQQIYPFVQAAYPNLCDDSLRENRADGKGSEIAWKHNVRWAQLALQEDGIIKLNKETDFWSLLK